MELPFFSHFLIDIRPKVIFNLWKKGIIFRKYFDSYFYCYFLDNLIIFQMKLFPLKTKLYRLFFATELDYIGETSQFLLFLSKLLFDGGRVSLVKSRKIELNFLVLVSSSPDYFNDQGPGCEILSKICSIILNGLIFLKITRLHQYKSFFNQ